MEEIKEGESAFMAVPVGSYHLESTYQNINATDYSATVIVHCEQAQKPQHNLLSRADRNITYALTFTKALPTFSKLTVQTLMWRAEAIF
jgi:hypothetical protein